MASPEKRKKPKHEDSLNRFPQTSIAYRSGAFLVSPNWCYQRFLLTQAKHWGILTVHETHGNRRPISVSGACKPRLRQIPDGRTAMKRARARRNDHQESL